MPIDSTLRNLIIKNGYITIDQMMQQVLSANSASYYRQQSKLGEEGDFTTAPEISQLFGEIIGLWCIEQWQKLGSPPKINLVELGAGRGLLMRDLLKVAKLVPEFYSSLQIELVEINPHFINWQKLNLNQFHLKINWLEAIYNITENCPAIIIANEFFDALPIKQYIKEKELWYESTLILDPQDGKVKFSKIDIYKELQAQFQQDHPNARDGAVLEESLASLETVRFIAKHLSNFKGSSLVIDYGYEIEPYSRTRSQYTSTLQALKAHCYSPILETLGEADLSAHVDFYALQKAALEQKISSTVIKSQGNFLIEYGILLRKDILKQSLDAEKSKIIDNQVDRLISPKQMGALFKVMSLSN